MVTTDPHKILQVVPTAEPEVIRAAYRALAIKYHPDRDTSSYAARRMREINDAYAQLRAAPPARRPGLSERVAPTPTSSKLSFGRYAGWNLGDLARKDPDYLRWLSRTASGIGYRTEIYQILGRTGAAA
ncbi:MAG TPA: DnaJ domain-containing protein [Candidatus Limnocylindria bacterium]|nr:DnaJ domain-containing protein [Candidatus Limnocylindria bacterium]